MACEESVAGLYGTAKAGNDLPDRIKNIWILTLVTKIFFMQGKCNPGLKEVRPDLTFLHKNGGCSRSTEDLRLWMKKSISNMALLEKSISNSERRAPYI